MRPEPGLRGSVMEPYFVVEYEPRLVEAAVLAAVTRHPEERAFRRQRDWLYEAPDSEERERLFDELHASWFVRLGLDRLVRTLLDERPEIARACWRCVLARAPGARQEAADLRMAPPALPTLLVSLQPETLRDPERLTCFLRRELLHVADMLDPAFGYVPRITDASGGPSARLLADRYRALWDAFVDGRLVRLGHLPVSVRAERLRDVARVFPDLGEQTEATFERFFGTDRCTHAEIAAVASRASATCCRLCSLPTRAFEPAPARLPAAALAAIAADFPSWTPADGLCVRCAELYRHRARTQATAPRHSIT